MKWGVGSGFLCRQKTERELLIRMEVEGFIYCRRSVELVRLPGKLTGKLKQPMRSCHVIHSHRLFPVTAKLQILFLPTFQESIQKKKTNIDIYTIFSFSTYIF